MKFQNKEKFETHKKSQLRVHVMGNSWPHDDKLRKYLSLKLDSQILLDSMFK